MGTEVLSPSSGIYVDDALVTTYKESITQLITDLGRKFTLHLPPQQIDCPNCFVISPYGSMIYGKNGPMEINKIQEGDYVLTHDSTYQKVTKIYKRMYKGTLNKITYWGCHAPIICTEDHPIFTDNLQYVHAHALKSKQNILRILDKNLKNRSLLDYINVNWQKYYKIKKPNFPNAIPVNSELLKIIGMYIAEGSGNGSVSIALSCEEQELACQIEKSFYSIFGINYRRRYHKSKTMEILIGNSALSSWLKDICGHGCENKHIPYELYNNLSQSQLLELIDYIIEGDGNIHNKELNSTAIHITSKELSFQIFYTWQNCGLNPSIYANKLRTNRKQSWTTYHRNGSYDRRYHTKVNDFSFKSKIYKIESYYDECEVYNLQVENNNNYVINGILVHNCGYDSVTRHSNNRYTPNASGFNTVFPIGSICPVCNGAGTLPIYRNFVYTALVRRTPNDLNYEFYGVDPSTTLRLKTVLGTHQDLVDADFVVLDGQKYIKITEPVLTGLRNNAFVVSFWKRSV